MRNFLNALIHFFHHQKSLTFWIIIIIISFFYQYQNIIVLRPQSIHAWRQTDCASQALNYSQNGMNFFKPEIHYRVADDGSTGYCVEEFPILFYITACFYKIFGFHEWIFRLLTIIIFFSGLFALFKLSYKFFKDYVISVFLGILLFLSTVFVFYANNFTSNTSSFAIALIGWYFFFQFKIEAKNKYLYVSLALFSMAALLKISDAMSLIVVAGIYFFETSNLIKFDRNKRIFNNKGLHIIPFIFAFCIIIGWYLYAAYFNKLHNQIYYVFALNPIWNMDANQIKATWQSISTRWFPEYFHFSIFLLIFISTIGNLVFIRKANRVLLFIWVTIFIGSIIYLMCWFKNLADHDYYTITIYMFFIFSLLTFTDILNRNFRKFLTSLILKITIILVVILNLILTRNHYVARYNGWQNDQELTKDIQTVSPFLRLLGIDRNDKVICFPDPTVNYSLYLMNQPGWTSFYDYTDEAHMKYFISKGAKYLILLGDNILKQPYLKSYLYHPIGKYGNVKIFKLDNIENDKDIKEMFSFEVNSEVICDAETYSSAKKAFIGGNQLEFTSENLQSNEKSHSGKYSAKVNLKNAFTMSILFASVRAGSNYKVSIWRYPAGSKSQIAACIKSASSFYKSDFKSEKIDENGWELISMEFEVPKELNNEKMGIYPSYTGRDSGFCYFDDLKIQYFTKK